jgi:cell division protein FtsB
MCIRSLKKENEELSQKSASFKSEIHSLSSELDNKVSKEEYDNLSAQKKHLQLKFNKLKQDLEEKTIEHEGLQKNYIWLEKEYNTLYENIEEEKKA